MVAGEGGGRAVAFGGGGWRDGGGGDAGSGECVWDQVTAQSVIMRELGIEKV